MSDTEDAKASGKKKKGKGKLLVMVLGLLVLGGAGGGGYFAWSSGMLGGGAHGTEGNGPRLVPKREQKRVSASGEGGGHGEEGGGAGSKPPSGSGGEKYASNYYAMEKEFTSNLQDSVHFIQVGLAISTPYDDSVIENIKTNEIAVRSAILMTLGDTTEEQVFTSDGKKLLERRLAKSINDTLKEKEGFGGVGNVYFTNFVVQ
ncbi:flagellar basal body-associated FliL family protein [Sphingomonas sp. QA11]|uniref:flagellar basal body-associated FliL family protein n=1 Tax=Sphingomonas sp. QA11 TaxID=2950605 RepID=UPI00234ABF5C|nr:flagellar basal body-associated FliL family protein [Sphingomonas sp. QA11]WCM26617.1 flagellar basal body-associated FliL family protein [Sphingomonas sp. QA11]